MKYDMHKDERLENNKVGITVSLNVVNRGNLN